MVGELTHRLIEWCYQQVWSCCHHSLITHIINLFGRWWTITKDSINIKANHGRIQIETIIQLRINRITIHRGSTFIWLSTRSNRPEFDMNITLPPSSVPSSVGRSLNIYRGWAFRISSNSVECFVVINCNICNTVCVSRNLLINWNFNLHDQIIVIK